MVRVSGNATIRAGSSDVKTYQLLQNDGITPISNFTSATKIYMRLTNVKDGVVTELKSDDPSPKITFNNKTEATVDVVFSDFTEPAVYKFHFRWSADSMWYPVPEDRDETLRIISDYPPS